MHKSRKALGDESLCKICHYQQNVLQHCYLLDTLVLLSEILAHVMVHNNTCKCIKQWYSVFVNSEKHAQQCTVNVQQSPKEAEIFLNHSFFFMVGLHVSLSL